LTLTAKEQSGIEVVNEAQQVYMCKIVTNTVCSQLTMPEINVRHYRT